jgi:hypothetical protein
VVELLQGIHDILGGTAVLGIDHKVEVTVFARQDAAIQGLFAAGTVSGNQSPMQNSVRGNGRDPDFATLHRRSFEVSGNNCVSDNAWFRCVIARASSTEQKGE